ncbi:MAG TPA: polysaccharide deacetylase family protein [Gemmatimonadales bacterium]|nr:polysaccharide deacetylase family protein [Gemmatimonadales bacterium]
MMGFDVIFGPSIERGPRTRRVYLTFDDGPNERATPAILETLARERIPAAFFMVGDHVRRFPNIARQVSSAGHVVGNHTYDHLKLHFAGPKKIRTQLKKTHEMIASVTGVAPRSFRAPHGYRSPFLISIIVDMSYTVFGWTFGVFDTAKPGVDEIRRRVRKRLRPGAIVLLHDGDGYDPEGDRMQTADALGGIIRDARDAGYEFGSLTELLHNGGSPDIAGISASSPYRPARRAPSSPD